MVRIIGFGGSNLGRQPTSESLVIASRGCRNITLLQSSGDRAVAAIHDAHHRSSVLAEMQSLRMVTTATVRTADLHSSDPKKRKEVRKQVASPRSRLRFKKGVLATKSSLTSYIPALARGLCFRRRRVVMREPSFIRKVLYGSRRFLRCRRSLLQGGLCRCQYGHSIPCDGVWYRGR
jgi:hypothetical protein